MLFILEMLSRINNMLKFAKSVGNAATNVRLGSNDGDWCTEHTTGGSANWLPTQTKSIHPYIPLGSNKSAINAGVE